MKIIDAIRESITNNRQFFGVEFFPPHMEAGRLKLYDCMERLFHQTEPLFCGITWGDGGSTSRETIEIADAAQRLAPILMQVHVTGSGCTEQQMIRWLEDIKRRDLKNLFLLRGVRLPSFNRLARNRSNVAATANENSNSAVNQNEQQQSNNTKSPSPVVVTSAQNQNATSKLNTSDSSTPKSSPSASASSNSLLPHKFPSSVSPSTTSVDALAAADSNNNNNLTTGQTSNTTTTIKNNEKKPTSSSLPPTSTIVPSSSFDHAVDLVRFVRKQFGSHFGITVAGYPEGHHEGEDRATSIKHLKEKIDAGADLVICQFVFDAKTFLQFCEDCRNAGITCPIIPSIVAIHSVTHFKRMANLRRHAGMDVLEEKLKQVSSTDDDEAVRDVVVDFMANLIRQLFRSGVRGVYFMTQNVDVITRKIIAKVAELRSLSGIDFNMINTNLSNKNSNNSNNNDDKDQQSSSNSNTPGNSDLSSPSSYMMMDRPLPWKASLRHSERARPIYWSSRPASYLAALDGISRYDDHPNDRWSNASSPAFGEQYHHVKELINATAKLCPAFLQVKSLHDVSQAFVDFLNGKGSLPWSAGDGLAAESDALLTNVLLPMNKRGLLTINSQPAVNGAPSEDKTYGWGPRGGFVYQKQYLEFFCSPAALDKVISIFESFPSVVYMAQRRDRSGRRTNMPNPQGSSWIEAGFNENASNSNNEEATSATTTTRNNNNNLNEESATSTPPSSSTATFKTSSAASSLLLRKSQKERNRILTSGTHRNKNSNILKDQISLSAIFAGTGGVVRNNNNSNTATSGQSGTGNNNNHNLPPSTSNNNPKPTAHHLHAAVTWGVFPSQDIVQPTFVSSSAFDVWTPEAFTMWLYPFHGHSSAEQIPQVIHDIVEGWYLVTALDNDFNNSSKNVNSEEQQVGKESTSEEGTTAAGVVESDSNSNDVVTTSNPSTPATNNSNPSMGNFATPLNAAVSRICAILPEI